MNEKEFKDKFEKLSVASKILVESLKIKKSYKGFTRLLTDLYPDKAHFIFELLQNAQDAKGTSVQFRLFEDRLEFEHNGTKQFDIGDIEAITSIGYDDSTKKDDPTTIGKFGVGFKAVFLYTNAPEIYSGDIQFKIEELFVPIWIEKSTTLESNQTLFVFHFNHPKKSKQEAYLQIENGLNDLNSTSLLFLTNISKIRIERNGLLQRTLERKELGNKRVDIIGEIEPSNWLVFQKELTLIVKEKEESEHQTREITKEKVFTISTAFSFDSYANKIIPVKGEVCVYFPCESITSNLKFHINAPFSSTVARDSIIDCEENSTMLGAIADLIASSLVWIKDNNLLTTDFIAVLPNSKDNLDDFYKPVWQKVVAKFQSEELVLMDDGSYANASCLFYGNLKERALLKDEQLAGFLNCFETEERYSSPMWVKSWFQGNRRIQDFYEDLGIENWTMAKMVSKLTQSDSSQFLTLQSPKWHRELYAALNEEKAILTFKEEKYDRNKINANDLKIIKLKNGSYSTAKNCFFPDKAIKEEKNFACVDKEVYSYNDEKGSIVEDKSAKEFLEKAGVKYIGDRELIEKILNQKYSINSSPTIINEDIIKFIDYYNKNKDESSSIFSNYKIFKTTTLEFVKGKQIYINKGRGHGLDEFFHRANPYSTNQEKRYELSQEYFEQGLNEESIINFVKATGGIDQLLPIEIEIKDLKKWNDNDLGISEGMSISRKSDDENYTIEYLEEVLKYQFTNRIDDEIIKELGEDVITKYKSSLSICLSRLVWKTMNALDEKYLTASHRPKSKKNPEFGDSSLIHILKNNVWVPQDSNAIFSLVKPANAIIELLPKDFECDTRKEWLKRIEFGVKAEKEKNSQSDDERKEEEKIFKKYGISKDSLQSAKKLEAAGFTETEINDIINSKKRQSVLFNQKEIKNLERRETKVKERLDTAPNKTTELRTRSVSVSDKQIDPRQYLRELYTTDERMGCQLCSSEMPFKKRDGNYYFEAVEVLTSNFLIKEFEAQHLALCPECAARYQEHAKEDTSKMEEIKDQLLQERNNPINLTLDNKTFKLQFVDTHRFDLRIALQEAEKENS